MAVTTIKSTYSLEVESVRAGGVGTSLDGVEVRSVAAGSCLCSVGHPPGRSAGSRPHPYSCKQPAIQGHSLARRTKPAFTGFSSIVPGFVRAGRPRSRVVFVRARRPRSRVVLCAGETPALPGGAGETPALTPSPRPTLGGSLSSILQRLSGPLAVLRGPSWIALFAFLWISYVSWLCSSATISRATSRARSGWPGGREMAATTGWPPPP